MSAGAGNGCAVERDEALLPPTAPFVDGAGDEFLPRPCLAEKQDGGVTRGDHLDESQHLPQRRALTHDPGETILAAEIFGR